MRGPASSRTVAGWADDPETSVVRGTGLALEHFEVLKRNQSCLR